MDFKLPLLRILKCGTLAILFCLCTFFAWPTFYFTEYHTVGSPNATINRTTWKTVLPLWVYVYSAYARLNPNNTASATIAITAIVSRKNPPANDTVTCQCTYRDELVDGVINIFVEHHDHEYAAATILCDMTNSQFKNPGFLRLRCQVGNITRSVELYVPKSPSSNQAPHSFGLCGPVIFGANIKPEHVIQFVEYYQVMGAARYIFYPYENSALPASTEILHSNATKDLMKVLRYYERLGRVQLENWAIPADTAGKIHYNGQVAALNECILRVAGHWSYVVVVDLDEYIISRNGAGLKWIMENQARDCLTIRMSVARVPLASMNHPFPRISRKITRESYVWNTNERSKYICRPEKVVMAAIHYVNYPSPNTTVSVANASETLLLHFNGVSVPQSDASFSIDMAEVLGLARLDQFLENVISTYKEIFNGPSI